MNFSNTKTIKFLKMNTNLLNTKTMKTIKFLAVPLLFLALFASCSDDDAPEPVNEEEVITTLRLTLTPQGGGAAVVFQSRDLDGNGPNAPIVDGGALQASTTYSGAVEVLNELENPIENKTTEVAEEADEHQFFFSFIGATGSTVTYNDADVNGSPLGLSITLVTGAASATNTLTVTLLHEPNKSAAGVNTGDMTNAGGETDIQVAFPFSIN